MIRLSVMHMRINLKRRPNSIDLPRLLERIDSKVDVIPFITMKYLSQKQESSNKNSTEFQEKYGITFRDYELLTNIIKKQEAKEDSCLSDVKSALNVLKNSSNEDIKEIFSRVDEEKITKEIFDDIVEILESEDDLKKLFKQVNYLQYAIKNEDNKRIIPPTVELLSNLASTNRKTNNVYDPSSIDAQTITELDDFNHATIHIKDEEDYYHAKQNLILSDISQDKVSMYNDEILIDEDDKKYDTIISVPYSKQKIKNENIERYAEYESKNPKLIHLLNMIDHLDSDGLLVTTTTQGLLVKKDALKLRKYLIDNNLLDVVIEYESGYRSRDITILVINNNKKTDDFLFIKPPEMFPTFLLPAFNENILEIYKERKIEPRLSNIINKDEIIKNEYNLNPKRYVYTLDYKKVAVDDILKNQREYSDEIKKLDDEIDDMLSMLTD